MCGRYFVDAAEENAELMQIISEAARNATVAPKTGEVFPSDAAAVLASGAAQVMRWGFPAPRGIIINARSETAPEKAMFREALARRRCLVPASGFYEWKKDASGKIRHAIRPMIGRCMYMAGLFGPFDGEARFVILTQPAARGMEDIHDRMPVILEEKNDRLRWLFDDSAAPLLLQAPPKPTLRIRAVDPTQISMF